MEILNTNFQEKLQVMIESIEECEFLAIDSEFTGLFLSEDEAFDESDSLEDRYQKLRKSCENFFMCQLGISTFILDPSSNSYKVRSFTIYTLPYCKDRPLAISPSSMRFLVDHNFDMNKLFKSGIPCTRLSQATTLPTETRSTLSKLGQSSNEQVMNYVSILMNFITSTDTSIDLEFSNPYQKSLITGPCGAVKHFKNLTYGLLDNENVVRVSKTEGKDPILSPPKESVAVTENEEIFSELGVSIVFAAVLNARKPIVVHNGLFDLGFLYTHFVDRLADRLAEFKNDIRNLFPDVYDTKVIARMVDESPFRRLNLEGLYSTCVKMEELQVRFYVEDEFGAVEERMHEAGYDSFLTGVIFLYLREYFKKLQPSISPWDSLSKYTNCICLAKIHKLYLNLNYIDKSTSESTSRSDYIIKFKLLQPQTLPQLSEYFCKYGDIFLKKLPNGEYFVKYERIYSGASIKSIISNLSCVKLFNFT